MGICAECIYRGDKKPSPNACRRFSENYICTCLDNAEMDYITGEIILSSCRIKNQFGECLSFDDGKEDVTLFAWKKDGDLFFTKSENPALKDLIYSKDLEETGKVTSIITMFSWSSNDDPDQIVFTKTNVPEVGFNVFDITGTEFGEIEAIEENSLTFNSIVFTRTSDADFIFVNDSIRSPDDDFSARLEREDLKINEEEGESSGDDVVNDENEVQQP